MTGTATRITPDNGSTRPGATANHRFSSAEAVVAARAGACACVLAAGTASEVASTAKFRAARKAVLTFGVIMTSAPLFFAVLAGPFTDDPPVFDVHDAIGERQDTWIVGYDQN